MSDLQILEIFRGEAGMRLDSMVETLLAVESRRAEPDAIESLFRDAHTIKGAAGILGLTGVRSLAHRLENTLVDVRTSGGFPPEAVEWLLQQADALRAQLERDTSGGKPKVHEQVAGEVVPAEPEPRTGEGRFVRVPAEKLDRLLDVVGETLLHRGRLEYAVGADERVRELESLADELDVGGRLLGELRDTALGMRMLPLSSVTGPFARAVRDIASREGTEVKVVVGGTETELDRVVVEGLAEPLVHLLRNAVAHGIEPPEERHRAGKQARGTIRLEAEQRGRLVTITVADDGRGVPAGVLRQARLARKPLVDLLTEPVFSTAAETTDVADRGVGLSTVKRAVESYGGTVEVESEPGSGTRVTLLLPLTLALLDVLLVERGRHIFGLPIAAIDEVIPAEPGGARGYVEVRGTIVPLADLADVLGAGAPPLSGSVPAIVVSASGHQFAAACNLVLGKEEVVVKSLGALLGSLGGYLGAAILGDGRIALLLDPEELVRRGGGGARPHAPTTATQPEARPQEGKVLLVDGSLVSRQLQRLVLGAAGYPVETARNAGEALQRIHEHGGIAVVVADVELPGVDGFELTRAIRSREGLPPPRIVLQGAAHQRRAGIDCGADAFVVKQSFDQRALVAAVARLIQRSARRGGTTTQCR